VNIFSPKARETVVFLKAGTRTECPPLFENRAGYSRSLSVSPPFNKCHPERSQWLCVVSCAAKDLTNKGKQFASAVLSVSLRYGNGEAQAGNIWAIVDMVVFLYDHYLWLFLGKRRFPIFPKAIFFTQWGIFRNNYRKRLSGYYL